MRPRTSLLERLINQTQFGLGCWEWQGSDDGTGYGKIGAWASDGTTRISPKAHRVMWTFMNGPIHDDLTIDHLCRNRPCVNPTHMELVTIQENIARRPVNTHCHQGHLIADVGRTADRSCAECSRQRKARYRERQRAITGTTE